MTKSPHETTVNIISEGTRLEGKILFDDVSRVHGILIGDIQAKEGSTLVLGETSVVEGNIDADILLIDGYVRGDVSARTRIVVSRTGRVLGNIKTPSLTVEFGAYFEGSCAMDKTEKTARAEKPSITSDLSQ
jgi:cytoskeletal protein CcmA (bactofilin family)